MNRCTVVFLVGSLLFALGCGSDSATGPSDPPDTTGPTVPTLVLTTAALPDAVTTVAYSQTMAATGGNGIYTWSMVTGSLPAGLSLNAATGVISGTPTTAESQGFVVQVASGDGQTAQKGLSITVGVPEILQASELCSDHPDHAIATFEDPTLEGSVRALIPGQPQDITCGALLGLTTLTATGEEEGSPKITSLVGLQNLRNLTELDLGDNSITDISPVSGLTSLTTLNLAANSITDISAVSGLTSLTELILPVNSITDMTPVSGLTNLTGLSLWGNLIADITPVSGMGSLTKLSLGRNPFTDFSAVSGLTNLTHLYLFGNSISDIGPVSGLTNLTYLSLYDNSITDISAVSGLTKLTYLSLRENSITDISPLSGLTDLTHLYLYLNSISDITSLSGLTNIETLYMFGNSIDDISALSGFSRLSRLSLSGNSIADITPLSGLSSLSYLNLGLNLITDISTLGEITSLTELRLYSNSITDITALTGLTSLFDIDLSWNSDLSDIQPLLDNSGLGVGDTVDLYSTKVKCSDVAALEGKGVTVPSFDCLPDAPAFVGDWTLTGGQLSGAPITGLTASLELNEDLTYEASFSDGTNTGSVTASYTVTDDTFESNLGNIVLNGTSSSFTFVDGVPVTLWSATMSTSTTAFNNYGRTAVGHSSGGTIVLSVSDDTLILTQGATVLTYARDGSSAPPQANIPDPDQECGRSDLYQGRVSCFLSGERPRS